MTDDERAPANIRALIAYPGQGAVFLQTLTRQPGSSSLYDQIRAIVGGIVEGIRFADDATAYLHEEGKYEGLDPNPAADLLCQAAGTGLMPGDWIAGPFIVTGRLDPQGHRTGEDYDVPDSVLNLCRQIGIEIVDHSIG